MCYDCVSLGPGVSAEPLTIKTKLQEAGDRGIHLVILAAVQRAQAPGAPGEPVNSSKKWNRSPLRGTDKSVGVLFNLGGTGWGQRLDILRSWEPRWLRPWSSRLLVPRFSIGHSQV